MGRVIHEHGRLATGLLNHPADRWVVEVKAGETTTIALGKEW